MNSLSLDISNAAVSESQLAAMTVEADESLGFPWMGAASI